MKKIPVSEQLNALFAIGAEGQQLIFCSPLSDRTEDGTQSFDMCDPKNPNDVIRTTFKSEEISMDNRPSLVAVRNTQ